MWYFGLVLCVLAVGKAIALQNYNPTYKCPAVDGPDSVYFPDSDCHYFWQCSNGLAYKHVCAADLHFNPILNICDYPYRAGCKRNNDDGTTTTEKTTTISTTTTTMMPDTTPSCKAQPTRCTCTCEPIPDDEPTTTSIWTTPSTTPTTTTSKPVKPSDDCENLSYLCPAIDPEQLVYIPLANCSSFCQCSNGKAHYYSCPGDLHFNPTLNVCDCPSRAGCIGPASTTTPTPTPTQPSNECDKLSPQCPKVDSNDSVYIPLANCSAFCQCSNGKAYYHPCPAGLHFNPKLNVCDWPANAGCTGSSGTTPTTPSTTRKPTTPAPTTTQPSNECDGLSYQCPKVDSNDSFYIPLANCSAFCQCSNGRAYYHPCPSGLHFNPTLNVCDWPANAGCTGSSETTPSTTPSTTRKPTTPTPTQPSNECDGLSSQCPKVDSNDSVYIPLANCSAFCQCSNGKAYYHPCPAGLHFNPKLNVCDWPANAGCTGSSGTTPSTTPPTTRKPTTPTPTPTQPSDECDGLSSQCPKVDSNDSVYIPLANCSAFCQCSNGKAYYHPCPSGLHFNPTLNVCDWPANAGCTGSSGTTSSTTPSTTRKPTTPTQPSNECDGLSSQCPKVDSNESVYIPLANCSAFCQCSNGKAYYHPCPSGLHFNPTLNVCDWPANAGCTGSSGTTPSTTPSATRKPTTPTQPSNECDGLSSQCPKVDSNDSVYIPLANCSAFCQCSNGKAYYHPCPAGLHFSPKLNVCDWPANAGCTGSSGTTPSTTPSTTRKPTTPTPTPTQPSDECDGLSSQCPKVDSNDSVYIPLANCSAFCQCSNGKAHYHPCPAGLHFNPKLNDCDWPANAGCKGSPRTTPPSNPLTTRKPTTSTSTPTQPGNECDGLSSHCPRVDSNYSVYIPLANCSAFCQCSNGKAYYHPCPAGLHFNPTLNVCDWPLDAGCTVVAGTTSTTQEAIPSLTPEEICKPYANQFYLVPNPMDCASYISCDHGNAVIMSCSSGLYFDPISFVCNWPDQVNCTAQ